MIIGIDIDGVLANQIAGVLPRLKQRFGVDLSYDDITAFRLELNGSNLSAEILDAMHDPTYVEGMPVHAGAEQFLTSLRVRHTVKLITARPAYALPSTEAWLAANGLPFDELIPAAEALKSHHGADILVDDYIGNIAEFLANSPGLAIVLDQPWNQNLDELEEWCEQRRLLKAKDLAAALTLIENASVPAASIY